MSKWSKARKNRLLKEKRSPHIRLEKITNLKREIKFWKSLLPRREKDVKEMERRARWAKYDLNHMKSEIERMEKELGELMEYERGEK